MSAGFIVIVTALYLAASISDAMEGKWPMAGVWLMYAGANCFLIWNGMR